MMVRYDLEDLGPDGRITLRWISKKYCARMWTGFNYYIGADLLGLYAI
jgi:hypothetical protein